MCRISGIFDPHLDISILKDIAVKMSDAQHKGGPDDDGLYFHPFSQFAVSHRRLSLLDLSTLGHQPMLSEDQRVIIVFNGEVYNYRELKELLIKESGCSFKSETDTEVILNAYKSWGVKCFSKFNGMFAFSLIDLTKNVMYLVRDEMGIKPLYIYHKGSTIAFASETRAFKNAQLSLTALKDWPVYFMSMGHLPEPFTTYNEVQMLPKGSYLTVNLSTGEQSGPNIFQYLSNFKAQVNTQDNIDDLLEKSIERQLYADAPIGVFLSGGIDSSLLALKGSAIKKEQLISLSINFNETKFSEQQYQNSVLKKLNGAHHECLVTKADFEQYFEEILEGMDQPSVDGINTWFISKAAHDIGLKAVLSGIGADEVFGGYPSFKRSKYIPYLKTFRSVAEISNRFLKNDALHRISYLAKDHEAYEYLFYRGFFNPKQLKELFGISSDIQFAAIQKLPDPSSEAKQHYDGKRAAYFEQNYFMQNQLLKDTDNMSMQHGLEIRVPFLDLDLIHYCSKLSAKELYPSNEPAKHYLIKAFNHILPEAVWNRPKMGFTFPFQEWLKTHPQYLTIKHSYPTLKSFFEDFEDGRVHWSKIMCLLVLVKFNGQIFSN